MYVFDTNVVSELRKMKSGRADVSVVRWTQSVPSDSIYLPAIAIYEIKLGILKLASRDKQQAAELDAWLTGQILSDFLQKNSADR